MPTVYNGIDGVQNISGWISNGLNQDAIKFAESFGADLAGRRLSTSQIRNVFGEVRRLQMKGENQYFDTELLLLKPKLAYAKARRAGIGNDAMESAGDLQKILSAGIDAVFIKDDKQKFDKFLNFANFFEAVLAYHKAAGGK